MASNSGKDADMREHNIVTDELHFKTNEADIDDKIIEFTEQNM